MEKGFWKRFLVIVFVWAFFTFAVVLFFFQFLELPLWAKILIPLVCLALLPVALIATELARKKKERK